MRFCKAAEDVVIFREDVVDLRGPEAFAEREAMLKARLCELINSSSLMEFVEQWQLSWKPVDRFHLGPAQELQDHTMVAPLVRSRPRMARQRAEEGERTVSRG